MRSALVLLAHGSPNPDWRGPLDDLCAAIRRHDASIPCELAFLEHGPSLRQTVRGLSERGFARVAVIAAFLSSGGRHVREDLPALVAEVSSEFQAVELSLVPGALAEFENVRAAMVEAAIGALAHHD